MKRILLSCLTLLLAISFANAQLTPDHPTYVDSSDGLTKIASRVDSAVIFVCKADLTPIDLTYDVLGVHLDVSKGEWRAAYPTTLTADQYDGKNVFKAVNANVGTYVFDFISLSDEAYCNVGEGEFFRAYVHVLPSFGEDIANSITICESHPNPSANPIDWIPNDIKTALDNAGLTYAVSASDPNTFPSITSTTFTKAGSPYTFEAVIKVNGLPNQSDPSARPYSCDQEFHLVFTVNVVDIMEAVPPTFILKNFCMIGIAGIQPADPWTFFGRQKLAGDKYEQEIGGVWTDISTIGIQFSEMASLAVGTTVVIRYTWVDCDGLNPEVINDAIKLTDTKTADDLQDLTHYMCKPGEPLAKPGLSYLYDKRQVIDGITGVPISSLQVHWTYLGVGSGSTVPDPSISSNNNNVINAVDKSKLWANQPYKWQFSVDASENECYAGSTGEFIIIAKDGAPNSHGRIQVCQSAHNILVNNLMGFSSPATWTPITPSSPNYNPTTQAIEITASTAPSTYKYQYNVSGNGNDDCGASEGVFYVKVTPNVLVPENIVEKYCRATLPEMLDMNYVLGAYVEGTWTVTPAISDPAVWDASTGMFDIAKYAGSSSASGDETLVFEFTSDAGSCLAGKKITITIILTNDIS